MTATRTLLIAAAVAAAIGILAAAALNPSVETWAARRAIARARGSVKSVGRVSLALDRATIEGLRVEAGGAVLTAPRIDARIGVIPAALGWGLNFERLVAIGWTLDLIHSGAAAAAEAEAPLPVRAVGGVLSAFNLPANLSLDGVDLEGDVLFPDEFGRPGGRVHVVVTGGGLAAGRDGRFLCRATATVDDPRAPVSSVTVNATLTAALEGSGDLLRAELKAEATAVGRDFPNGISLSCAASAAHRDARRYYAISLLRGSERIGGIDAEKPDGSPSISGSWRLDLRDTDLAPFALGRSLPAFYAAGDGSIETDTVSGDIHAVGRLRASADRLGVLSKALGSVGRVDLTADFDVARLGSSLRVARLDTTLAAAAPAFTVRALQPFEFNSSTGELKVAEPTGDLVGVSLTGVPLVWLRPLLGGLGVTGGDARGEFVLRAEDGRLAVRTKAPLTARDLAITWNGSTVATGLDLTAFVLSDYAPQGWQVQLSPMTIRSDGLRMFSLEARFGRLTGEGRTVKAAGSWSTSLPTLLSIPALARLPRLSSGDASGSFLASFDSTRAVRVKLAVRDLAGPPGLDLALPSIDSEIRADFDAGGHTTFSVPLRLDYGARAAVVAVSGSVEAGPKGSFVDASLSGDRLTEEDLAAVSFLSGGGKPDAASSAAQGAPAAPVPARPLWPALSGRFALRIEELSLGPLDLSDVRGTLNVEPRSLSILGGTANVGGGGLGRIEGRLDLDPGADRPLSFKADASVDNVDSMPFFLTGDPNRQPTLEGRFDIAGHLTGSGQGFGDLLDRVQGAIKLSSRDGKFRALRTGIIESLRQAPSRLVEALDTMSSLFGKKPEKIGQALVETATGLSEVHYDQMNVACERGPDLDVRLTEINLIAPEARLAGTGRITYSEGVPIEDQPLSVDLSLGVRGRLGKFLDIVGLLADGQDELGYSRLNQPIHLGGTLRSVDQSQWKDLLVQASLKKGNGIFDKLLGR